MNADARPYKCGQIFWSAKCPLRPESFGFVKAINDEQQYVVGVAPACQRRIEKCAVTKACRFHVQWSPVLDSHRRCEYTWRSWYWSFKWSCHCKARSRFSAAGAEEQCRNCECPQHVWHWACSVFFRMPMEKHQNFAHRYQKVVQLAASWRPGCIDAHA